MTHLVQIILHPCRAVSVVISVLINKNTPKSKNLGVRKVGLRDWGENDSQIIYDESKTIPRSCMIASKDVK